MLNIIVAYNNKNVIGKGGKIPWHLPEDLKRFKEITMSYPIIMGRKTHESIGKILKGRTNIIISRDENYIPLETSEPVYVATSLSSALEIAFQINENVFVIGGEQIYKMAMPFADRMYLSFLNTEEDGDVYFPPFKWDEWKWERLGATEEMICPLGPLCEWWVLTREKKVRE